jgi:peptide/nickel transport system ATP-binding protein
MTDIPLLDVRDLTVEFATRNGTVRAVQQISLSVRKGQTIGIVGESGSGKSVTSYAVMRLLDRAGRIAGGTITFGGMALQSATEAEMRELRGREMSMIFQNPRAALNPIRPVGRQLADALLRHGQATRGDVRRKTVDLLRQVRINNPEQRVHAYPFELSGGMCQRVVIALALACQPELLIADEPTTGLDVTTQKAVMDLVTELTRARGMSSILITHDLGLAAAYCDDILVMEQGRIVERAATAELFAEPRHVYTRRLIRATPRPGIALAQLLPAGVAAPPIPDPPSAEVLLDITDLVKEFPGKADGLMRLRGAAPAPIRAVDGISFQLHRGETLGLVGESGCGKSTTSMMIMRLLDPNSGRIVFNGTEISALPARGFARNPLRRRVQMVFQDPTDSLNPRFTASRAIAEPLLRFTALRGAALRAQCEALARMVGLPVELLDRFPHQLSGGQKARVGIARAIAVEPDLLVLDEPTAALDVSVQAVVLNLLQELKARLRMSYLFVSHDLHVVRLLCDRALVMRGGKMVEEGDVAQVLEAPRAEYTRALIAAAPRPPRSHLQDVT